MTPKEDELIALRISLARIAQVLGVDNDLLVTNRGYSELHAAAAIRDRGWNDLAARIHEKACNLMDAAESRSHMRIEGFGEGGVLAAKFIAGKFVQILARDLPPSMFFEMCKRNETVEQGICASHDFCDANMVMEEAFHYLGIATCADIGEDDPDLRQAHEDACALWSEAWALAMPMIGGRVGK